MNSPTVGLRPRYVVDCARGQEILEAFARYLGNADAIPAEWVIEFEEIVDRERARIQAKEKDAKIMRELLGGPFSNQPPVDSAST